MNKATGLNTDTLQVEDVCSRLREALKRRHPRNTAKLVARDLEPWDGANVRTVEDWLSETDPKWPIARHFVALINAYTPQIVIEICAPDKMDWDEIERLRSLKRRLTALAAEEGL